MSQTQAKWALIGAVNRKKKMDRDNRINRLNGEIRMIEMEAKIYKEMLEARSFRYRDVWKWVVPDFPVN